MISKQKWFERKFVFDLSGDMLPLIVERLRGTPARMEERLGGLSVQQLTKKVHGSWSIQENAGHLLDLEPLWAGRLEDLMSGAKQLRPADLTNMATDTANHNAKSLDEILSSFRAIRRSFVSRLDKLNEKEALLSALHPRLKQPMRLLDLVYFIAEHDDHHLSRITELLVEHKIAAGELFKRPH